MKTASFLFIISSIITGFLVGQVEQANSNLLLAYQAGKQSVKPIYLKEKIDVAKLCTSWWFDSKEDFNQAKKRVCK